VSLHVNRENFVSAIKTSGVSYKDIAREVGVSLDTIRNVLKGMTWKRAVPDLVHEAVGAFIAKHLDGADRSSDARRGSAEPNETPESSSAESEATESPDPERADEGAPNSFAEAADAAPKMDLDDHLKNITAKSSGAEVAKAAAAALADDHDRELVREALLKRGVGPRKIIDALGKPAGPKSAPPPPGVDTTGLSDGYFRKADGAIWRVEYDPRAQMSREIPVCSPIEALYWASDGGGGEWALVVRVRDKRGHSHDVRLPKAELYIEPREALRRIVRFDFEYDCHTDRALLPIKHARVPNVRWLDVAGHHAFGGAPVFVTPSRVVGTLKGEEVRWGGDSRHGRTSEAGTFGGWKTNVAAPCDGNPILQASIGTMLTSPAIPYFEGRESNRMLHVFGDTSIGKTTTLQASGSVWGKGAPTDVLGSFLESWSATANGLELVLKAHNHIGLALDEIRQVDPSAAASIAYKLSSGISKSRMTPDISARPALAWSLFGLSSGEKTLSDLVEEQGFRKRRGLDGGAGARVLDIPADNVFRQLHGAADGAAFAEKLGKAAMTDYGHAGPAYAAWLLDHPDEARKRLRRLAIVWGYVELALLPISVAGQARRVAKGLGTMAMGAALAADVLELPWKTTDAVVSDAVKNAKASVRAAGKPRCGPMASS
jgi:Domain of unknown function (DUF927)